MRLKKHVLLGCGIILCSSLLCNAVLAKSDIRVDGFVSVIGGTTLSDSEGRLNGYDDDLNFSPDSLFAVQIQSNMENDLSATAQLVARGADDYDPSVEWAYLSYQIHSEWKANAGKLRMPFYVHSDFLDVGYAYHWITPPNVVYDLPFNDLDGISVEYLTDIGDWTSRLTLIAGRNDADLDFGALEVTNTLGAAWALEHNWLTLRAAYFQADLSVTNADMQPSADFDIADSDTWITAHDSLTGAGNLLSVDVSDTINAINADEDKGNFLGLGATIDYDNFLLVAEYTQVIIDNTIFSDQENYYLSVGYRFGNTLVHVSYGHEDEESQTQISENLNAIIPAGVGFDELRSGIEKTVYSQESEIDTWSIGTRYDFHPMAAFKVEYKVRDIKTANRDPAAILFGIDATF